MEFSLSELKKVQGISLGGSGLQILLTIVVTTLTALGVGWVTTIPQGIFLGAVLSLSSTAVVLKCLMERNEMGTLHAQVMLGMLVIQELGGGADAGDFTCPGFPAGTDGDRLGVGR